MMTNKTAGLALVTGANRGIGFEVCRQLADRGFVVLLSARDANKAGAAATSLASVGRVEALVMDVADANSDVLINNAGINYDTWETGHQGRAECADAHTRG